MICNCFLLCQDDVFQICNYLLLDLQIYLELNILQLKYVIFNYHLKKISVAFKFNLFANIISNFLCACHALHELQISDLFSNNIFVCAHLQSLDGLCQRSYLLSCLFSLL